MVSIGVLWLSILSPQRVCPQVSQLVRRVKVHGRVHHMLTSGHTALACAIRPTKSISHWLAVSATLMWQAGHRAKSERRKTPARRRRYQMEERLQKIIARAGIASRRHAEELIASGLVTVNGQTVTELGTK